MLKEANTASFWYDYEMNPFLAAQIAGTIAALFSLLMYQFNNRKTMLILDICGGIFWAITFLNLHAPTGLYIVIIGIFANLAFLVVKPTRSNLWLLGLILTAIAAATVATWGGPVSLLAMGGSMLYTIRFWTNNTTTIRRLSLAAPPLWFVYDMITMNYPGAFIEVFAVVSNLLAQYRFDFPHKNKVIHQKH